MGLGLLPAGIVLALVTIGNVLPRFGVALYLFGITFGLGTIVHLLWFRSIRIRQIAGLN